MPFWCCSPQESILKAHTLPNFEVAGMLEVQLITFSQSDCETFRLRTRGRTGIAVLRDVKMVPA
jgi:hypothetical protein